LPKDAIIARLGGDEYVALVFVEPDSQVCSGFSKGIIALIHQRIAEFNACSDKPYLVELSMGSYEFVCDEDTCIEAIINLSDEIMYHEKQKRRTSIKKSR
jgi:predicted signal transduction protein with EAL and GGDEF domain